MDLVAGVRKEGSRGGRADFKWSDVTASTHRENYLGHSLMAPVGRWQKNKDLSWYAKGDKTSEEAAEARREEIQKVKEAEQAAMGEALGFGPAALIGVKEGNANETPLGEGKGKDIEKIGEGGVQGTPEERALRRIVEGERAKGGMRSRSRSRDRNRDRERERRHKRRDDNDDGGEGRARRRHHHRRHHRERELSRDRSRSGLKDEESHRHRYREERYRERSYDRRRSQSRERRRSFSRERERDYGRRR